MAGLDAGSGNSGLGFNTIVLHDMRVENVDTEGRVYVGNDFTTRGYTVGSRLSLDTTRYDLVVGGNILIYDPLDAANVWGLSVPNGRISYGGTFTGQEYIQSPPYNVRAPAAVENITLVDPATVTTEMQQWSTDLAAQTPNGTVSGTSFICPSGVSLCIINGNASNVASAVYVQADAGTTVLINIFDDRVVMWDYAMSFGGGVTRETVLWNFPQTTDMSIGNISWQGTILAPFSYLYFQTGNIEGQLIIYDWLMDEGITGGEMHPYLFEGCPWVCI